MSKTLLCQLGMHPIILPEAFLLAPNDFTEVHAITTDNKKADLSLVFDFFKKYPAVNFTVSVIKDFELVTSAQQHEVYEETLWRWYIDKMPEGGLPYVCLSGGVKTMVASLQKATHLFGADDIFHVLVNRPEPSSLVELEANQHRIDFVRLGKEDGWGTLRHLCTPNFAPVVYVPRNEGGFYLTPPQNFLLRSSVEQLLEMTRHQTDPRSAELPFNSLTLLSKETHAWLEQPLIWEDLPWLETLPKTELHCHLGGFGAFGDLLELVRKAGEDEASFGATIVPPDKWPFPNETVTLDTYMRLGDNTGSKLFKNAKRLRKQIELLYEHLVEQNVLYAEIRCSPDNYRDRTQNRTAWNVLEDIQDIFQELMDNDGRCHVNLIVIATRIQKGDLSPISRHLALAITAAQNTTDDDKCRIVGVDLAGFEDKETRASYFANDFIGVHRCGLAVTAHAGENDDAEGIWQAVHALHARRLGHALHLWQAPDLLRSVADRKIAIEMCPYANYQIKGFEPMTNGNGELYQKYPLLEYLRKGVMVTVNTDNIGISDASLSQNFQLLVKLCPEITRLDVLRLIRNGIEAAFVSPAFRNKMLLNFDRVVYQSCNI